MNELSWKKQIEKQKDETPKNKSSIIAFILFYAFVRANFSDLGFII